mgnify:FL=1
MIGTLGWTLFDPKFLIDKWGERGLGLSPFISARWFVHRHKIFSPPIAAVLIARPWWSGYSSKLKLIFSHPIAVALFWVSDYLGKLKIIFSPPIAGLNHKSMIMRVIILIASLGLLFIAHHISDGSINFDRAMNFIIAWTCFGLGCIRLAAFALSW